MLSFKGTHFPKDVILVLSLCLLSVVTPPVQAAVDYTVTRSCPNDFSSITFISAPSAGMYSEKEKQLTNHLLKLSIILFYENWKRRGNYLKNHLELRQNPQGTLSGSPYFCESSFWASKPKFAAKA
jgi:hypothetical protein